MYAIVREAMYDPSALEERGRKQLAEFQAIHAAQPGYVGSVVVELAPDRWLTVNLWEREQDAADALPVMVPVVQRLIEPLLAGPSKLLGAGRVILTDLGKGSRRGPRVSVTPADARTRDRRRSP